MIFTKTVAPFATLDRDLRSGLYEKKYRIAFADLDIQKAFYRLLENRCSECNHTPFIEFNKLKDHVRKVHELFFCEICTDNLKIFSNERRCYTRSQLATHRRVGDPDDKSHKGHPRCDYCELRYLDRDELFKHLRREHYFCHLCDADGNNIFFGAINEMRDHFKSEHFLCEEDECVDEHISAVFRTEIDLKAHVAVTHTRGMTKSDLKQARTLDLEFSYGPRGRGGASGQESTRGHRVRTNDTQREFDGNPEQTIVQNPQIKIDSNSEEQFPSLAGPSAPHSVQLANTVRHITYGTSGLARTKENFPSLGDTPINETKKVMNQPAGKGKQSKMPTASSLLKGTTPKASKNNNNRPQQSSAPSSGGLKQNALDFPALSSSSSNASSFFKTPAPVTKQSPIKNRQQTSAPSVKKNVPDFPALSHSNSKKKNKVDLLEDMVLPSSNVNMNLVSSKHRGLVEDYVSMAAQVSKVQTVQQKDIQSMPSELIQKNVPKLNSADNFPTLGSASDGSSSAPQWFTATSNAKWRPEQKKGKKIHEMPLKEDLKPQSNGSAKLQQKLEPKQVTNGFEKEKVKSNSFKNKNENNLNINSEPKPPPGFSSGQPKKPPPGFKNIPDSFVFSPPPNASLRNQALVGEFKKALKTSETMQEFRNVSQMFRDGDYFPKSYYETCKFVLNDYFDTIFPELLTLLPDIEKQQV